MTKLSDLSFSEVVNDFKVAPTFVLNCRAGKLTSFSLSEVEQLFDGAEGKTSDQVRLLERLGFLERVVEQRGRRRGRCSGFRKLSLHPLLGLCLRPPVCSCASRSRMRSHRSCLSTTTPQSFGYNPGGLSPPRQRRPDCSSGGCDMGRALLRTGFEYHTRRRARRTDPGIGFCA